ncbi:hypothetical protein JQ634_03735 [Bradyrhizobium sp. AUGA SZCCT0240]|uniref:hypothetical protein n=1 Tax=unclassified Bradyrhizobium TaxID=2631580 RepID=UPI001BA4CB93|nr:MULTISPECIES: hypothetical protein [unclassified Bradyrhizobium]MBR1192045.1 hypothetical protein [Bradyrhizobium sp. AUGA SZCCT0160]MBR1194417.1 hypothetical protein [Bradyrhizobium sp. AUGA SZCCT0158]MBR1245233.1 hypothetical protein [Bradyrhizobium sp. AUGA SZCCT0274]MBR1252809.1 hypothetical protein [Bradyrhizobium sp. AUGA SZCCT0240]
MKRKRWSDDDIAKLRGMAQKMPPTQIAAALGRGVAAVTVKAHELKLSLRMHPNPAGQRPTADASEVDVRLE